MSRRPFCGRLFFEGVIRMSNSRNKPSVAFWGAMVLVALLAMYPIAWGPWIWFEMTKNPPDAIRIVGNGAFAPLEWLGRHRLLPEFYFRYIERCAVAGVKVNS